MDHPPEFSDTDPKTLKVWFEMLRRRSPGQKLLDVLDMMDFLQALQAGDERERHPDASEHEILMRVAARRLDRETMIKVYGWDPKEHGAGLRGIKASA